MGRRRDRLRVRLRRLGPATPMLFLSDVQRHIAEQVIIALTPPSMAELARRDEEINAADPATASNTGCQPRHHPSRRGSRRLNSAPHSPGPVWLRPGLVALGALAYISFLAGSYYAPGRPWLAGRRRGLVYGGLPLLLLKYYSALKRWGQRLRSWCRRFMGSPTAPTSPYSNAAMATASGLFALTVLSLGLHSVVATLLRRSPLTPDLLSYYELTIAIAGLLIIFSIFMAQLLDWPSLPPARPEDVPAMRAGGVE